jgi:hypothetical protein
LFVKKSWFYYDFPSVKISPCSGEIAGRPPLARKFVPFSAVAPADVLQFPLVNVPMQYLKILDCLEDGRWGLHDRDPEPKNSSTSEVWSGCYLSVFSFRSWSRWVNLRPPLRQCRKKIAASAFFGQPKKMENMFLRKKHVVQKYIGFYR